MYHVYPGTMFTQLFHYYSDLRMSNFNKNNIFWYLKSQKQRKTTYSGGNQGPDLGQAYGRGWVKPRKQCSHTFNRCHY
jgi:hypothetical protein